MSKITISSHATEEMAQKAAAHLAEALGQNGYPIEVKPLRGETYCIEVTSEDGEPGTLAYIAQQLLHKAAE